MRDRAWSMRLGAASVELLWSLLPQCPAGAIVDLWLDPRRDAGSAQRGLARAGVQAAFEILCDCPAEVAAQRYAERPRHAGHLRADEATLQRIRESGPLMAPLQIGPALRVDTTRAVDLDSIVAWLRTVSAVAS
jgi:glucokinase